jgi:uncharacterized protein YgfB (UPF0149 family)
MVSRTVPWDHFVPLQAIGNIAKMSDQLVDHAVLDEALRRCGSSWGAGQAHGLLCGRLSVGGAEGAREWLEQVLAETDPDNALRRECEVMLDELCSTTWQQLVERQSEFQLLLPDDGDAASERATAMAHWCEGFLHGLVATQHSDPLKARLAEEPLADIIKDMLQITRATAGEDDDEDVESAYAELVEYLRVAAQLTYEELAEFRQPAEEALPAENDTLH